MDNRLHEPGDMIDAIHAWIHGLFAPSVLGRAQEWEAAQSFEVKSKTWVKNGGMRVSRPLTRRNSGRADRPVNPVSYNGG